MAFVKAVRNKVCFLMTGHLWAALTTAHTFRWPVAVLRLGRVRRGAVSLGIVQPGLVEFGNA